NELTITNKFIKEVVDQYPEILLHENVNDAYVILEKVKKDIIYVAELSDVYKKLGNDIEYYTAHLDLYDDLFTVLINFKKGNNVISSLRVSYGLNITKVSKIPQIQIEFKRENKFINRDVL
ncbi:hypothetical protein V6O07_12750, partial [Arthrospira platensis SPKY2]